MYRPPHFKLADEDHMIALAQAHSFATLVSQGPDGLVATHLPLLVERMAEGAVTIIGHFAKANTQWKTYDGSRPALAIFQGAHGYISPRYYKNDRLVPTWNYSAVHASGYPTFTEDADATMAILHRLTDFYEAAVEKPWSVNQLPLDFQAAQRKGLVAFSMPVTKLEGKRKLSQNRNPEDRAVAIEGLRATGDSGDQALADDMQAAFDAKT